MNAFKTTLLSGCIALTSFAAMAQDAMKKDDSMMKKEMTMQDCKDHMAMAKKDGMKKDDAMMMKKESMCSDMMKKDSMMKDGAASAPMKK